MSLRVLTTLVAGAVVGAGVVMLSRDSWVPDDRGTTSPTTAPSGPGSTTAPSVGPEQVAAAHAYLDTVRPIALEAGRVVQEGMKPAIAELADPEGDHERQVQDAPGWEAAMDAARRDWAAASPPPALRDAHQLFLGALDTYVEAAQGLAQAATDDDGRTTLVEETIELGTRGDDLYDRAARMVQTHLVAGGVDPVTWLPQPRDNP